MVDVVLDKALSLRGVVGVLVLTRDSWLTIGSRGALSSHDAPVIHDILSATQDGSTGAIKWPVEDSVKDNDDEISLRAHSLHFHRAPTHTLLLLRSLNIPSTRGVPVPSSARPPSQSFLSPIAAPASRMRFRFSQSSRLTRTTSSSSVDPHLKINVDPEGRSKVDVPSPDPDALRPGAASMSLFAPSCSVNSDDPNRILLPEDRHRPSSWY